MADTNAVVYSLGFVETWIETAESLTNENRTVNNTDIALAHLRIVEDALHEYRHTIETMRALLRDLKTRVDLGAQL